MKKLSLLLTIFTVAIPSLLLAGCSSGSDSATTDAPPKGAMPETVNAPVGAKNPEERGREEAAGSPQGEVDK